MRCFKHAMLMGASDPRSGRLRRSFARLFAAVVCALFASAASDARAEYLQMEVKLSRNEARAADRDARGFLDDAASFQNPEKKKSFDSYYNDYMFPLMAQADPKALSYAGKGRLAILRDLGGRRTSDQGHRYLTKMTFDAMKKIATEDYHPVARYNAVILLGQLDEKRGEDGASPPVPLGEAADVLLSLLPIDAKNVPDALKIGALRGLERHMQYGGLSPERSAKLTTAALAMIEEERPKARSAEGHAWIQSLCAETLAKQGALGEDLRVHKALLKLIGDSTRPINHRCREAMTLALLKDKYTPDAGVDPEATAAALATLAKDVTEVESKEAKEFIEMTIGAGPGRVQNPEDVVKYPRRRLVARANALLTALDAVDAVLSGDAKPHVAEMREGLVAIRNLAGTKDGIDINLTRTIEDRIAPQIIAAANKLIPSGASETETPEVDALDALESES